ncbi:MAG: PDZ domain-containing protein [Sediminibacterium sp.]
MKKYFLLLLLLVNASFLQAQTVGFGIVIEKGKSRKIEKVLPASPAEKAGFKAGDIVMIINGRFTDDLDGDSITEELNKEKKATILVERDGESIAKEMTKAPIKNVPATTNTKSNPSYSNSSVSGTASNSNTTATTPGNTNPPPSVSNNPFDRKGAGSVSSTSLNDVSRTMSPMMIANPGSAYWKQVCFDNIDKIDKRRDDFIARLASLRELILLKTSSTTRKENKNKFETERDKIIQEIQLTINEFKDTVPAANIQSLEESKKNIIKNYQWGYVY